MTKYSTVLTAASLAMLLALFAAAPLARADIFRWEYINPANPGLGKQPSSTLAPDGAGANAVPGAILSNRNLTKAYLIGANLSGAHAGSTNLTNAELSHANLTSAFFTGETVDDYFYGSNLNGANLSQANLTNVSLGPSTLINANLSQVNLTGAGLAGNYIVYGGEEGGILHFPGTNLTGANLTGANLTNADFSGILDPLFDYSPGANFSEANLSGADARGANFFLASLDGANTSNLIQSGGHIAGLDLSAGASLVVRDYDGNPFVFPRIGPLPIVVEQHLAMDATGTLRLVFDADAWDSTISFAPGIPVTRGGMLELTFASDVNLASQIGRTIDLFDWTGVMPTGAFTVSSPYTWNLTNLYTTGEVHLAALSAVPGDLNNNGRVDAADYIVWRKSDGTPAGYNAWRTHFGESSGAGNGVTGTSPSQAAVPECSSVLLLILGAALGTFKGHRIASRVRSVS